MSRTLPALAIQNLNGQTVPGMHIRYIKTAENSCPPIVAGHRDDYFVFIFQQSGESTVMIDFAELTLSGCCITYVLPGCAHRLVSARDARGWLLGVSEELIDEQHRELLFRERSGIAAPLAPGRTGQMEAIAKAIEDEQSLGRAAQPAIAAHLVSAYAGCFITHYQSGIAIPGISRTANIVKHFSRLLRENCRQQKSPAWYAAKLHISRAYLNECVKAATGQSAGMIIQKEIVLEGKRLLAKSDSTVKEIAFELGYGAPSYFNRLFFKITGERPVAFRKNYRK